MKAIRSMVLVSCDPASLEHGARAVFRRFQAELRSAGLSEEIQLSTIYDIGGDAAKPLVIVYPDAVVYGPVRPEDVPALVEQHLCWGQIGKDLLALARHPDIELGWLSARRGTLPAQNRIVLERAGRIDPESLEDYILHDGYQALGRVLAEMQPAGVTAEIDRSGLRGRGGAGFPAGRKMKFVAEAQGQPKYVICNADESEPGTFKDRLVLEGDPFSILEAMTIAAYAVGAQEGFIYIRGEYGLAYRRLEKTIATAHAHGLLGEHIFGTGFNFHIHLHSGAGAYICGEETALIESIEGKRGQPRARPPYPPTYGLWGKPTLVNNVETLANLPPILRRGADWYRGLGTPGSAGTKVFTILGRVNFTGAIEVPMGITLREVIQIYGKGMKNGAKLKLAQTGGSSGTIIPASLQDTPLNYDSYRQAGVSLGSGALLICDEHTCVVDLAKVLMQFFRFESCGKCTLCRNGTQRSYELLCRIAEGTAVASDLDELQEINENMTALSNCGLGQTACTPLGDVLKHFWDEVAAHVYDRQCPAGVCSVARLPIHLGLVRQPSPSGTQRSEIP